MGRRFGVATKVHQVVLEDLEAWVQQLYEEFGGQCEWAVRYPPTWSSLRPCVRLSVFQERPKKDREELWQSYEVVSFTEQGAVEAAMLRLVSKALLELESDRERAERQRTFL